MDSVGARRAQTNSHDQIVISFFTYLDTHIVVTGPVEVLVGPLGERLLTELFSGAMVVERELRVRLEELRLLHWVFDFVVL